MKNIKKRWNAPTPKRWKKVKKITGMIVKSITGAAVIVNAASGLEIPSWMNIAFAIILFIAGMIFTFSGLQVEKK